LYYHIKRVGQVITVELMEKTIEQGKASDAYCETRRRRFFCKWYQF